MSAMLAELIESASQLFAANVRDLALEEALFASSGYRSILGVLKHLGGWLHVYRAYAFDERPQHWDATSWPRGMRDVVDVSKEYVDEVIAWIHDGFERWLADLAGADPDELRPVHWRDTMPLRSIVVMVANHVAYHTGELNMLLSIKRGEAWELGEEVEENHIDTYGHGLRGPWMNDETAAYYDERIRKAREARLSD